MVQYAQDRHLSHPDECWFYHVMDLPEFGTVNHFGSWDLRGRFDDYVAHTTLAGKTLLDVGCASGFLSFEAEKRGAIVTSFDVSGGDVVNVDPRTDAAAKHAEVIMMQNGYWLAHRLLNSKARVVYGDACELARFVEPVDIVLIGQMLVHVRDPLAVIEQACKVAKETIIIAEGSWEAEQPLGKFVGAEYPWNECMVALVHRILSGEPKYLRLQSRKGNEIDLSLQSPRCTWDVRNMHLHRAPLLVKGARLSRRPIEMSTSHDLTTVRRFKLERRPAKETGEEMR